MAPLGMCTGVRSWSGKCLVVLFSSLLLSWLVLFCAKFTKSSTFPSYFSKSKVFFLMNLYDSCIAESACVILQFRKVPILFASLVSLMNA